MNTNMTGFRWFSKTLRPCALYESSLSIERVNTFDNNSKIDHLLTKYLEENCRLGLDQHFFSKY